MRRLRARSSHWPDRRSPTADRTWTASSSSTSRGASRRTTSWPWRGGRSARSGIGHTGTLDPLATGVLPLACGTATRLVALPHGVGQGLRRASSASALTTDTYDVTGTGRPPTADAGRRATAVERALAALRGSYLQTPPAFSAKKVDGRARLRHGAPRRAGRADSRCR